ncbi:MAG: tandem-95 repeat protein [Pirellulales bacterium]|nr:tandem-95 repeat protein [Pirellulales bacterium]
MNRFGQQEPECASSRKRSRRASASQRKMWLSTRGRASFARYAALEPLEQRTVLAAPVAIDDLAVTVDDVPVVMSVMANDFDQDIGGGISLSSGVIVAPPQHGTAVFNPASGALVYDPVPGFTGSDQILYTVRNLAGVTSNVATARINVLPITTVPLAIPDLFGTEEDRPITFDVLANDVSIGAPLDRTTIEITSPPTLGSAYVDPFTGIITYSPNTQAAGQDTFSYRVRNTAGIPSNVALVGVTILPVADPPIANNDVAVVPEDTPTPIGILGNDTVLPGEAAIDTNSVVILQQPTKGIFVGTGGALLYTPFPNVTGNDSFTYTVASTAGARSLPALVTIFIAPVNDAPVAVDDTGQVFENTQTTFVVAANDTDIDGTIIANTVTIVSGPNHGVAVVDPASGAIFYTPTTDYSGPDLIQYRVRDNQGTLSNVATLRITVLEVNTLPVAVNDFGSTLEEVATMINLVANDTDQDNGINPASVTIVTAATNGFVTVNALGVATYTPKPNFSGIDTFRYTVRDNGGALSNVATVTVSVQEVNDGPIIPDQDVSTPVNINRVIPLTALGTDVDGTIVPATIALVLEPAHGELIINQISGDAIYVPASGYSGLDVFTYRVRDDDNAVSNLATVIIRVGNPVSIAGSVYLDANNSGARDAGEIGLPGIEVRISKTDGPFTFTQTVFTDASGNYSLATSPQFGTLPPGTYDIVEIQPVAYLDGKDTAGLPPPSGAVQNDRFNSISIPSGTAATGFLFGEGNAKPGFAELIATGRFYNAAIGANGLTIFGASTQDINLVPGPIFLAFNGGWDGSATFQADYAPIPEFVSLILYDANLLNPVTGTIVNNTRTTLTATAAPGVARVLRVEGPSPSVDLSAVLANPPLALQAFSPEDTVGVVDPATAGFFLRATNNTGVADIAPFNYGYASPSLIPLSGDWDGDGIDTPGVYNRATATFYLRNSNTTGAGQITVQFGMANWLPVVGDWNGDGIDTIGAYSPLTAQFFLRNSNSTGTADIAPFNYGVPGWIPLAGDWDGDGIDTIAVHNSATAQYFLRNSNTTGVSDVPGFNYGIPGWVPLMGDWNGDGVDTVGVYDRSTATFYLRNSNTTGVADLPAFNYGMPGWFPIIGHWTAPESPLQVAGRATDALVPALADADLSPLVAEAIDRWAATGLPSAWVSLLQQTKVTVADLPGDLLGTAAGTHVQIDVNAAGRGWYVDETPNEDEEYALLADGWQALGGDAAGRIDLLSVIAHELGHVLGLPDVDDAHSGEGWTEVMGETLAAGERRLPR